MLRPDIVPASGVKTRDYNPTQSELEDPIVLRNADDSHATPEQFAYAVTRTVRVI
ncbi:MAG: hypothetical protein OXQ89_07265 [Rhodospirillaceae bacterium]|nr:hypothetical protein [Rhodospirillaceae bacterium]